MYCPYHEYTINRTTEVDKECFYENSMHAIELLEATVGIGLSTCGKSSMPQNYEITIGFEKFLVPNGSKQLKCSMKLWKNLEIPF